MQETVEFLNYFFQVELVLNGLKGMLSGVSTLELLVFSLSVLFLLGPSATGLQLWMLIFNLCHLVRGCLGLYLNKLVPNTMEVMDRLYFLH